MPTGIPVRRTLCTLPPRLRDAVTVLLLIVIITASCLDRMNKGSSAAYHRLPRDWQARLEYPRHFYHVTS